MNHFGIVIGRIGPDGHRGAVVMSCGESVEDAWTAAAQQTKTSVRTLKNKYRDYFYPATLSTQSYAEVARIGAATLNILPPAAEGELPREAPQESLSTIPTILLNPSSCPPFPSKNPSLPPSAPTAPDSTGWKSAA